MNTIMRLLILLRHSLTLRQQIWLLSLVLLFAIMPTRVFIGVSGDILQLAVIVVPFVIAFMVLILSIDTAFGLPIPQDSIENISKRRDKFSDQLKGMLQSALALIIVTLIAKVLALWFIDCGWLATIINRLFAGTVGGMIAILLIRLGAIQSIFGYLSVGADVAQRLRALRQGK